MSFESPFKVLYNNAGAEVAVVSGSQMDHARPGIAILAKDHAGSGSFLSVNETGKLLVEADVNVTLAASGAVDGDFADYDSVHVFGDLGVLKQDDNEVDGEGHLLVRDIKAKLAIDSAAEAITGSIATLETELETALGLVEGAITGSKNALLDVLTGSLLEAVVTSSNIRYLHASGTVAASADFDGVTIFGDEGLKFAQVATTGEMITMPLGSEGFAFLQAASGSTHHTEDNSALLVGLMGSASRNVLLSSNDDVLFVSATLTDTSISTNLGALAVVDFATGAEILELQNAVTAAQNAIVAKLGSDVDIRDLAHTADSVTAHQGGEWHVSQAGDWTVDRTVAKQASVTKQSLANSNVEVLDTDQAKFGASFYWSAPQGAVCYIRLGADAAQTDHYTVKLVNGGYYELPARYAGKVQAIADGGSGDLMVTKF